MRCQQWSLKMREARKQNVKINLNIDPFGDEFKKKLMKSFNFKENDVARILQSLKDGKISIQQLNALTTMGGYYDKNGNFISSNNNVGFNNNTKKLSKYALDKDGNVNNGTKKISYDKNCNNCKINMEDYIDRCKIPCKDCRDPAWKCPQDIEK